MAERREESRPGRPAPRVLPALLLICLIATGAAAAPLKVARLKYEGGGDWYANPTGLPNLVRATRERTTIDLAATAETVTLDDDRLFDCAAIFVTGHGQIKFKPEQARRLRKYLLSGGFMHVDDNYGLDESFRTAVKLVFPDRGLVELPFGHPVYHSFYKFPQGLPKIHEHHGGPPHGYGILDKGRVVLFYSYNTDLNDGWESAEVHKDPPERREAAVRMGVNLLVYALTH